MPPITNSIVEDAFLAVAPEVADELGELDPAADVWHELQLDSMDHLSVMEHLSNAIGHDIAESDYPRLLTLDSIRSYVSSTVG